MIALLVLLVNLAALPAAPATGPWDRPPQEWDQEDVYRILRDSPWSPAKVKLDTVYTQRYRDSLTGKVVDSPPNTGSAPLIRGVEISRSKPLPSITVLWWSSRTIRLAQQRLRQLRNPAGPAEPLRADAEPDYVIAIQGNEWFRILRDPQGALRDAVFLELPAGLALDVHDIRFFEESDTEDARVEFHFSRESDGRATLDADAERVIFNCKAAARMPRQGSPNALALRVEFEPRAMRVNGRPDL